MKKILRKMLMISLILLMFPLYINAQITNYDESVPKANTYITNFDNFHDYIVTEQMPYNYYEGKNQTNLKFTGGGFLSKDEYLITNIDGKSYLASGIEYWTLSQHSVDRNYVIDFALQSKELTDKTNVKVTQFVRSEVKVKGSGTKSTPWEFINVKSVNLYTSDPTKGTLSIDPCSDITGGINNITLRVYDGLDSEFYACTTQYYRYKKTSCTLYIKPIASSNKYIVDNTIKDNVICRVDFGYETYSINLKSCDNCSAVVPNQIFLAKNKANFFEDQWGDGLFSSLTTKPSKTGYTFKGYFYDKDNDLKTTDDRVNVIKNDGSIISSSKNEISKNIDIHPNFSANTYNITYSYAGGTAGSKNPSSGTYDQPIEISYPTRTGYTFAGWTITSGLNTSTAKYGTTDNPTTAISSSSTKVKAQFFKNITPTNEATVTFTANWTANTYQIKYVLNGGTKGSNAPTTGTYDSVLTISNPTRTGYTFTGWTITSGLNTSTAKHGTTNNPTTAISSSTTKITSQYFKNINTNAGEDVHFTANWTANSYSLSFNENGATTSGTKSLNVTYDSNLPKITIPQKKFTVTYNANGGTVSPSSATSTLTFEGYSYNSTKYFDANGNGTRTWNVASNVTLTAGWSAAPSVTLPTPTRTGYTFNGWNTKSDGSGTKYNAGASYTPSSSVTLYAQWTINKYTVTISRNNTSYGTVSSSSVSIPYGTTYSTSGNTLTFSNGTKVTATVTNVTGYNTIISSWSPSSGKITAATTITVNFSRSAKTFTVTFNANGGSTSTSSKTVTYNSTYGSLPTPTKTNNNFLGWYTSTSGGTKITSSSTVSITTNQTLYAQWQQLHTLPIFTYTGSYQLVTDNDTVIASGTNSKVTIPSSYSAYTGNWKIRFLSSGNITFHELRSASNGIDVFIVGGGGNGGTGYATQAGRWGYSSGGGGGGGGYTKTQKGVSVGTSTSYSISVGGARSSSSGFGYSASGGNNGSGGYANVGDCAGGPAGGSGTGAGGRGGVNMCSPYNGGAGVYEFGESQYSKRYGGGGGGGHGHNGGAPGVGTAGSGGAGGGGTGNNQYRGYNTHNGQANTGGGGGGASFVFDRYDACYGVSDSQCWCWTSDGCYDVTYTTMYPGGTGGSGIVIIRNKR